MSDYRRQARFWPIACACIMAALVAGVILSVLYLDPGRSQLHVWVEQGPVHIVGQIPGTGSSRSLRSLKKYIGMPSSEVISRFQFYIMAEKTHIYSARKGNISGKLLFIDSKGNHWYAIFGNGKFSHLTPILAAREGPKVSGGK